MILEMMKSKIHRATVTEACLDYVGSITIDEDLMDAASILENEKIQICNITNGNRFETYVIPGERGSGVICINGAAAHLASPGDLVILICYCLLDSNEVKRHRPTVVIVDENNKIIKSEDGEKHSTLY